MIKYCLLVAILAGSFTLSAQVKIVKDTLKAEATSQYDILQAIAQYYNLQLELKSPRGAYDKPYTMKFDLYNLQKVLSIFHYCTYMDYIIKGNKLMVGWGLKGHNP